MLGYEGIYTATASVLTTKNPSKAVLTDSARETLEGDRLIAADTEAPLNFMLSAPPENFKGRIISVVDGTELIGQYQVVVINRGARHGVVAGNVMAIDQAGERRTRSQQRRIRLEDRLRQARAPAGRACWHACWCSARSTA